MRSVLMVNLRSMDDLPVMERWLLSQHVEDTTKTLGSLLDRYFSYRVVAMPDGESPEDWGYYNWRVTELWWRTTPLDSVPKDVPKDPAERWPGGYNAIVGQPGALPRGGPWEPMAPIGGFLARRFTNDFKGKGLTLDDGPILRWLVVHRYPEAVDAEAADHWWAEVLAPEICLDPRLKRFFSTKFVGNPAHGMVRLSELWYESAADWREAVHNPLAARPEWAQTDFFPYVAPYTGFASTFILEAPSEDFLRHWRGYPEFLPH
jgi:hypothetical protein